MVKITEDKWYWPHNISECYYHIQLTIKYSKALFDDFKERIIIDVMSGFKDRYYIAVHMVGFDKNHVHILCRFCLNIQAVRSYA